MIRLQFFEARIQTTNPLFSECFGFFYSRIRVAVRIYEVLCNQENIVAVVPGKFS